jgi:ATP-dependent exoDNAse (exonuclease V) alpha subunit
MFKELDAVVLNHNIEEYNLKKGDIGTVVNIYEKSKALEVEFITAEGKMIAVLTLKPSDVRRMEKNEILHVRGFAAI